MNYYLKASLVFIILAVSGIHAFSQVDDYEDFLQRIDTIENPVYKPHISVSYGNLSFFGEVRHQNGITIFGSPAYKFNLTTFIDNAHYITANFFFMGGELSGEKRSLTDLSQNLNFSTSIYSVGATARYEFGHLLPEALKFRPFVAIGIEQINFNPKGDLFDNEGSFYYYWSDGTIRTLPENGRGAALPLHRDYNYETDLRKWEKEEYGLGNYSLRSFGVPFEVGITMKIMRNLYMSIGTEYHYTFTDFMDNVSSSGTQVKGDKFNDSYLFTSAGLHFDLFSEPKTKTVELLYADVEFDPLLFEDEDGDFIIDIADRCPGTPYGVITDSLGCPLDSDGDWVPDYLDKEPDTEAGAWVNDEGVTIEEDELQEMLQRDRALARKDLQAYMALYNEIHGDKIPKEIPEKFLSLDIDGDGYISFDELLLVIDAYFDYKIDLSLEELRELNEFFFSQ